MNKQRKSGATLRWVAGIAATVIAAVSIWWLTGEGGLLNPGPKQIDVAGIWKTPFENLSYRITQDDDSFTWLIRENGISGQGTVDGLRLEMEVNGEEVIYEAHRINRQDEPMALYTTHPKYAGVVLFKNCDDFEQFVDDLVNDLPELENAILSALRNVQNPTCPGAVD
ncbi:MAG: hypothetical protein K9G67_09145 [Bacteroidales bacterium]|nr:hypothetical protein [Bacteroidales bacterium]MCF8351516.1 hypothetical protein [Bacteroidales bacterium]MCF8376507.1 hypothetical protein [Bacteroidales bacterium]